MFELIRANKRRAFVLVVAMAALLGALGYGLGFAFWHRPLAGLVVAFAVWAALAAMTWFQGDAMILSASGARRIEKKDHPVLFDVVQEMTIAAGLPRAPDIYILDTEAPNAFATGRSPERAKIAVTAGLLERLDRDELQGVIGHEIGHVANRDVLYMMFATIMLGAIVMLADIGFYTFLFGGGAGGRRTSSNSGGGQAQAIMMVVALVLVIVAPIIAQLFYFALSRRREFLADASSARYTRYPEGLARALEKIASNTVPMPRVNRATAALFIANPLKAGASGMADLTSTHPPISARIAVLRAMAGDISYAGYDAAFKKVSGRAVGVVPFAAARESKPEAARAPSSSGAPAESRASRRRETTNALWSAQGYRFIRCPCGTTLKVPPGFPKRVVTCPNCGRDHRLGS